MISLTHWLKSERGATAIEYALIAGGIALMIVAAIFLAGGSLTDLFGFMASSMTSAAGKM